MPLAFPSHQGFLAPLWRLAPRRFSALALCVGALAPDLVDGVAGIVLRGRLGQWLGHSLLGVFALCVPSGLALTWAVRAWARRAAGREAGGRRAVLRRLATWLAAWTVAIDHAGTDPSRWRRLRVDAFSVWLGALSHVVTDLLSHAHSRLLWPWAEDPAWFPAWWYATWGRLPVPGYAGYPVGPHFVSWIALSIAGAAMWFRWPPPRGLRR
jgi:hypothetical protein